MSIESVVDAAEDNEVCSAECNEDGCWGPQEDQCVSCKNFHLGKTCLRSCEAEVGTYQSGPAECQRCDAECKRNCSGEVSE